MDKIMKKEDVFDVESGNVEIISRKSMIDTSSETYLLRDKANDLARKLSDTTIELTEVLYEIKEKKAYELWGYHSFKDYVETEVKKSLRTVNYRIDIYENLCSKLNVPKEEIAQIPWGNAKEIPKLIRRNIVNKENIEEWIEEAKEKKQVDFQLKVKSVLNKDDDEKLDDTDRETLNNKNLKLYNDQLKNTNEAIELAMKIIGTEHESVAVDNIMLQYKALNASVIGKEDKNLHLVKMLELIENNFNVRVIAYEKDMGNVLFGGEVTLSEIYEFENEEKVINFLRRNTKVINALHAIYGEVVRVHSMYEKIDADFKIKLIKENNKKKLLVSILYCDDYIADYDFQQEIDLYIDNMDSNIKKLIVVDISAKD